MLILRNKINPLIKMQIPNKMLTKGKEGVLDEEG